MLLTLEGHCDQPDATIEDVVRALVTFAATAGGFWTRPPSKSRRPSEPPGRTSRRLRNPSKGCRLLPPKPASGSPWCRSPTVGQTCSLPG